MTDKFRRNLILAGAALAAAPLSRAWAQPAAYANQIRYSCGFERNGALKCWYSLSKILQTKEKPCLSKS